MTLYREDPLKAVDWEGNPRRSSDSGAGTSGANTYFVYMGYYWKGVQLPLTAYHLPLPAFRLPLPASRLPLTAFRLPLTAYRCADDISAAAGCSTDTFFPALVGGHV